MFVRGGWAAKILISRALEEELSPRKGLELKKKSSNSGTVGFSRQGLMDWTANP